MRNLFGNLRGWVMLLVAFVSINIANAQELTRESAEDRVIPTHADAAIIFAKYSGLFNRYIKDDASLSDCVSFMNKTGVYFGLLEVINGSAFTVQDCARVMGQMHLIFSGEAEFIAGKVRLPKGIASWEEFCILNDVQYNEGYANLCATTLMLHRLVG